jgi:hypothetical protein
VGLIERRAGSLLALGLAAGLAWSVAVELSMPSWFDPTEACARKVGAGLSGDVEIRTRIFPPAASCVYGDEVRDFISPTRSVVLTVLGVLAFAILVTGFVLTVRRLSGDHGPARRPDGIDLRKRRRNQLLYGALDVGVVVAVLVFFNAVGLILGGIAGGVLFLLTAIIGLSGLCAALDRHTGPLPSTALESRRRGTVIGASVFGVVFAATAISGQLPFFRLWSIPVAAVTYVVLAALQWSRVVPRDYSRRPGSIF